MNRALAVVIGASGGIGAACAGALEVEYGYTVLRLSRNSEPPLDLLEEESMAAAAAHVAGMGAHLRLVLVASGFLHNAQIQPEKRLRDVSASHFAHAFAVNATGPALVLKHFVPLLPRKGPSMIAVLSAKVGSIGDNSSGGWFAYRASKAALNQVVRTASVELRRTHPEAICVTVHPGTVDTQLTAPFGKTGLNVRSPATAATEILSTLVGLSPADTGGFKDYAGRTVPW